MARHTTFRFCLDPTVEQSVALARHAGAARFAYNQCLRLHLDARERHRARRQSQWGADDADQARDGVPWSRFSLINTFNQWKRSEAAGRRFRVTGDGVAEVEVTGLAWRGEVSSQVLEEGAVDVGRGLAAWTDSRSGKRKGRPVRHPRFKKKTHTAGSFRMRNKTTGGRASIRIGQDRPRSVTLPKIGSIRVREDTRRLRRMIATGRARILQATDHPRSPPMVDLGHGRSLRPAPCRSAPDTPRRRHDRLGGGRPGPARPGRCRHSRRDRDPARPSGQDTDHGVAAAAASGTCCRA